MPPDAPTVGDAIRAPATQWMVDAWHRAGAWSSAHPMWHVVVSLFVIVIFLTMTAFHFRNIVSNLVIRRVFGTIPLPTIAESARRIQAAEARRAETMERLAQELEEHVMVMLAQVQTGEIPLTLAVNTPDERQVIEAMLARIYNVRVVATSNGQARAPKAVNRESVPTAWARLLVDDDEEGTPCPTTIEKPKPEPEKKTRKARAKKLPASRPPKNIPG